MNAIEDNIWSRGLKTLGATIARPRAVLVVSAHWYGRGLRVTWQPRPETIHDFGGFPRELFAVSYPAPGSPELAERVVKLLGHEESELSTDWGFDHGAWSVLVHLFPEADVPVVQLSVHSGFAPEEHLELGRKLALLRSEGIMILASGNVTHNLGLAFAAMRTGDPGTPEWAERFDAWTARALLDRDESHLLSLLDTPEGSLAHPTPDHWFPLLVAYGASVPSDHLTFPVEGFDLGSLSMRTCLWT